MSGTERWLCSTWKSRQCHPSSNRSVGLRPGVTKNSDCTATKIWNQQHCLQSNSTMATELYYWYLNKNINETCNVIFYHSWVLVAFFVLVGMGDGCFFKEKVHSGSSDCSASLQSDKVCFWNLGCYMLYSSSFSFKRVLLKEHVWRGNIQHIQLIYKEMKDYHANATTYVFIMALNPKLLLGC